MKYLIFILKGFIIGALMMVPGLSGGSLAIILGIYEIMLQSAANITKRESIFTLLSIGGGAVIGLFGVSYILVAIEGNAYLGYAVIGIVSATIISYLIKMQKKAIPFIILGAAIAFGIGLISKVNIEYNNFPAFLFLFAVLSLLAIGLILPGISFSYLLETFNLHSKLISSIHDLDVLFILIFGIILLFWILVTSKSLAFIFKKYHMQTDGLILGFLIISLKEIHYDFSNANIGIGIIMLIIGFAIAFLILKLTSKNENKEDKNLSESL